MIDISHKTSTLRIAEAEAVLHIGKAGLSAILEKRLPKGDPMPVARVAAVQAAKHTADIIPFCHPVPIEHVSVDFRVEEIEDGAYIHILVTVKAIYRTGVEMEAMTAASVAALTIYDMVKMVDETMVIQEVRLLKKQGGKSDQRDVFERRLRAAVVVMSDSIAAGKKSDASGTMIRSRLEEYGLEVLDYTIIPDEKAVIRKTVLQYIDTMGVDLLVTTGGTGFSPRDCTPEALEGIFDKEIPGIAEAIRVHGQARTPLAMLSRGIAGIRGKSIVLALPGSRGGVSDALDAVFPAILHSFKMLWMEDSPMHEAYPELSS